MLMTRLGVGGRLLIAFLAISAFAVLGAAAATYPLLEIGKVLDRIIQHRLPAALASQDLSRQAERIVAAAPALLTATDSAQHQELSRKIESEARRLGSLLGELKNNETDSKTIESLELIVNQLRVNLTALDSLVAARIGLKQRKEKLLAKVFSTHTDIHQLLAPWILVVEGEMSQAQKVISETDGSAGAHDLNKSIQSFRALQKAQLQVSVVKDMLHQISNASDDNRLKVLTFRVQRSLGEIEKLAESFTAKLRPLFLSQTAQFRNSALSADGLPKARETELDLVADAETLLQENSELSNKLTIAVDSLLKNVRQEAGKANVESQSVQTLSATILLSAVAVSLISSILIVWLYVGRNLVRRLTVLSNSMLAIAQGNLDTRVPSPGNDEIGRMAEALSIFRDTAVEVEEKNLRDISEARQRLVDAIEGTSEGFAFYDAEDRLVLCNSRYRALLYPGKNIRLEPGMTFEEVVRQAAEKGLIHSTGNNVEALVRERVERHRNPSGPFLQQRADGRWVQISERKTEGGDTVAVYTDLTELKRREEELAAAKDDAERALEELKLAQRSLVQSEKMASLGQLTAGIAHEIKNPLNFINNFAKSSNELLTELAEGIKPAKVQLEDTARDNIDDLLLTIREDIGTIREQGERADSIVKAMLLHSRGGTDTPQKTDLNELISESVKLAYHGKRASTPGFNVTLDTNLDSDLGNLELVAQEITRVLVNLLSNAFYAVHERQQSSEAGYEPTVSVSSRILDGDRAEIRIRDNGTGIPAEAIESLFTPFFTTKPAGEGTGLGLSISHDIVTDQHRGSIRAESEEGVYTEFIIELPRQLTQTAGVSA